MAIGPVGSAIYVNQQMATVASEKNAQLNRFALQNVAAAAATNEKETEVQEVRPTEESHMIDPDREHAKKEAEENMKREKRKDEKEDEEEKEIPPIHRLDIKV